MLRKSDAAAVICVCGRTNMKSCKCRTHLSRGDARIGKVAHHAPVTVLRCRALSRLRRRAGEHRVGHRGPVSKTARGRRVLKVHHAVTIALRRWWRRELTLVVVAGL